MARKKETARKAKSQSPKNMDKGQFQKSPMAQSMKKASNKPTPMSGKPSPKQVQTVKGGQTTPAKNIQTPKQALHFQTPKQNQKGQTPAKGQPSGKKVLTPHPMKKQAADLSDDEDDDDFETDESMDDDDIPTNGAASKKQMKKGGSAVKQLISSAKKGQTLQSAKQLKKPAESDEEEDDDDEFDSDDESLEDEFDTSASNDGITFGKNQKGKAMAKAKQAVGLAGRAVAQLKKVAAPEENSDEEDDDEEEWESDEDEEEIDSDDEVPAKGGQLQKQLQLKALSGKKQVPEKVKGQAQQPSKQLKRPAPEEESDDDDDEEDEDEEDEDDSEDDEMPAKGSTMKKVQQQGSQKKGVQQTSTKANANNAPPQKKLKANDGAAVAAQKKQNKEEIKRMPTKLDKKLQDETEERRRERDGRSLFIKNLPRNFSIADIKKLSPDIVFVNQKNKGQRFAWISFANDQVCQKNHEKLKEMKFGDSQLFVDFCGEKSQTGGPRGNVAEQRVDALRLYVGNMPAQTSEDELKRLFPTAKSIYHRFGNMYGFINFDSPEAARQAFEKSKNIKIDGTSIVVGYARVAEKKEHKPDAVKKFADQQASGKVAVKKE